MFKVNAKGSGTFSLKILLKKRGQDLGYCPGVLFFLQFETILKAGHHTCSTE